MELHQTGSIEEEVADLSEWAMVLHHKDSIFIEKARVSSQKGYLRLVLVEVFSF